MQAKAKQRAAPALRHFRIVWTAPPDEELVIAAGARAIEWGQAQRAPAKEVPPE